MCSKCLKWTEERKKDDPDEYGEYWKKHSGECPANYSGTSQGMESSAALEIWARSVTKHYLAYTTYVGDGDSSSFKRLRESDPYKGLENLRKEECIGHVREIKKGDEEENYENVNIQTNTRFKGSEDWPSLRTCYRSVLGATLKRPLHFQSKIARFHLQT